MKQLTIISGKGGTGKTTLSACFAVLAENKIIVDTDVDAPDLHLILHPTILSQEEFSGAKIAVKDKNKCTKCGKCEEICRFNAIRDLKIDYLRCEGCGVCVHICPEEAITLEDKPTGYIYNSETKYGPMIHARLKAGMETSGKLVTEVRNNARKISEGGSYNLIILDGSPGIGCPVIASLAGTDLALVVTEPTLSGLSDLKRIVGVAEHFKIETLVCINKYDINLKNAQEIKEFCEEKGIKLVGMIPFDPEVSRALAQGKVVVEVSNGPAAQAIHELWDAVSRCLFHSDN